MSSAAKAIMKAIKTRGYWEVDLRPDEPSEARFESISDCMEKVRESVVQLRGWDYPHFSRRDPPYPMQGRIEASVDFGYNKEYWTMFLNGHFYHLFACREDWLKETISLFGRSTYADISPGTVLGFLTTLYSVTEIFEFAIRLAQKDVFGRRVRMKIGLFRMEGRRISSFAPGRFIFREYVCKEKNITFDKWMRVEELIGRGHEIALETTVSIFELFNWLDVSRDMLRDDQRKLLEKRL
jgi:hypothetical protein